MLEARQMIKRDCTITEFSWSTVILPGLLTRHFFSAITWHIMAIIASKLHFLASHLYDDIIT